jgi:hypothetical protein
MENSKSDFGQWISVFIVADVSLKSDRWSFVRSEALIGYRVD